MKVAKIKVAQLPEQEARTRFQRWTWITSKLKHLSNLSELMFSQKRWRKSVSHCRVTNWIERLGWEYFGKTVLTVLTWLADGQFC